VGLALRTAVQARAAFIHEPVRRLLVPGVAARFGYAGLRVARTSAL